MFDAAVSWKPEFRMSASLAFTLLRFLCSSKFPPLSVSFWLVLSRTVSEFGARKLTESLSLPVAYWRQVRVFPDAHWLIDNFPRGGGHSKNCPCCLEMNYSRCHRVFCCLCNWAPHSFLVLATHGMPTTWHKLCVLRSFPKCTVRYRLLSNTATTRTTLFVFVHGNDVETDSSSRCDCERSDYCLQSYGSCYHLGDGLPLGHVAHV